MNKKLIIFIILILFLIAGGVFWWYNYNKENTFKEANEIKESTDNQNIKSIELEKPPFIKN